MRTIKTILAASICAAMACGCAKELQETHSGRVNADGRMHVCIDDAVSAGKTTIYIGGDPKVGKIFWEENDPVTINGTACKIVNVNAESRWMGDIDGISLTDGDAYEAFYPGALSNWVLPSVQTYAPDTNDEGGNVGGIYPMYGKGVVEDNFARFHNILGLLQIRICSSKPGETYTIKEIKVSDPEKGMCGAFAVTLTDTPDKWTAVLTDDTNKIPVTLDCGGGVTVDTEHVTDFYVGIPAGTYKALTITVTDAEGNTREVVNNVPANVTRSCIHTLEFAYPFNFRKTDVLPGEFSVTADTKVKFSRGNLWYDGSSFKFETNQYEFHKYDSASNTWGLFGWSASNNDGASTTDNYGMSTSTSNGDYSGTFYDWGKAIGNGITWSTLSTAEWTYLLNERAASTVSGTENARYAKATVCGNVGLILLPDVYVHPSNIAALTGINTADAAFSVNSFDLSAWTVMESAGAVFLPAAGSRSGSDIINVGSCFYWSNFTEGDEYAYRMSIKSVSVDPGSSVGRCNGFSVRLVTEVPASE